jgi:hypothetical protein
MIRFNRGFSMKDERGFCWLERSNEGLQNQLGRWKAYDRSPFSKVFAAGSVGNSGRLYARPRFSFSNRRRSCATGISRRLLPVLLSRRLSIAFERERLELEDDDFLDLGWARLGGDRLAILSHGLAGSSDDGYNRGMATALHAAEWDALAWNLHCCGKEMNLRAVVRAPRSRVSRGGPYFAVSNS